MFRASELELSEERVSETPVISIVDDDPSVRDGTRDLLNAMGFIAETFPCAADFLESDRLNTTSCLIADVQLPGMTGLELHDRLIGTGKAVPTILITAFPDDDDRTRALMAGVLCYLAKPFSERDLLACIQSAIAPRQGDAGGS